MLALLSFYALPSGRNRKTRWSIEAIFFTKMAKRRPLFVYFRSLKQQFNRKIVDFNGIQTRIVKVEGKHADHLTTAKCM